MKRIRNLLIGTVSIVALSAFPLHLDLGSMGSFDLGVAHAKGGNGNGNSGSHGNSASHGANAGNGNSGKAAGNKSASSHEPSKSLFGKDRTRSAKVAGTKSSSKANLAGTKSSSKMKFAKETGQKHTRVAMLPVSMDEPELTAKVKEKNFHAKLAGLNSLNRNYHAYLHSQSPKFAGIAAFVRASAEFDIANEKLDAANADLAAAQTDFDSAVAQSGITPFDGDTTAYDDPTLAGLQARLDHLNSITPATPEEQAALDAEVADLESLLGSSDAAALADAETAAADAQTAADQAAIGTDDQALKEALLDAANKNRVAQYGDDYIDNDIMDWAKDVLGVGNDFGKIDEVRESIRPGN